MKNSIPKGTGNSRYLKSGLSSSTSWEQFREMIRNGTLPIDLAGINQSGWEVLGDPLNKATLLSDATASLYGLGSNAVPDDVFGELIRLPQWNKLASYEVAGSYMWTAPDLFNGKNYNIGVLVIGAGGSGDCNKNRSGSTLANKTAYGGASGYSLYFEMLVVPLKSFSIIVGLGGASTSSSGSSSAYVRGTNGGSSSFNGKTANGGEGAYSLDIREIPEGGQNGTKKIKSHLLPFGGVIYNEESQTTDAPLSCFNPFENIRILGAGGAGVSASTDDQTTFYKGGKSLLTGKGGGDGAASRTLSTLKAQDADSPGCGGGGCSNYSSVATVTSGAGADGAVYIYIRGATV